MQIHKQRVHAKTIPARAHTMDLELEPLPRFKGAHVSSILKYIGQKTGIMREFAPAQEDPSAPVRGEFKMNFMMMAGLAWESYLFRRVPGIHWQPGEVIVDSIGMNCDGVNLGGYWDMPGSQERGTTADWLEECKVTWQSSSNPDLPGWYRLCQVMAYCHGFGLTRARLWIYHVRGDYKGDFGPQLFCHWIEFTPAELLGNWNMILRGKEEMERENREDREVESCPA